MSSDKDRVFFYNYSIVLGLLAVMIIIFLVLALYLGVDEDAVARKQATKVSANTVPVGVVYVLDETAEGVEVATVATVATREEPADMGLRVYNGLCISCHNGLPNIPRVGDKAAWETRITQGMALLYEHAIKGFISEGGIIAMPPRGGNMNLSDAEVKAAVDYMVANSQ